MAPNVKVLLKILNILLLRHVSEATEPINWIYISCNGKNGFWAPTFRVANTVKEISLCPEVSL